MAGYSGTPLPKKLGIKDNHVVALLDAPVGFGPTLTPLPHNVALHTDLAVAESFDVILFFTKSRSDLQRRFKALMKALHPDGGLWISWPKKASGVTTDISEDVVREIALAAGLVDNKVCAVDETWSGLRLVVRLKDRPKKKAT
jgi:Protein of unknown function (DUF3052)